MALNATERDRRWKATRGLILDTDLDCVVTAPGGTARQADSTYLTGHARTDRVACVMGPDGPPATLSISQGQDGGWVTPRKAGLDGMPQAIVEQIRSIASSARRIGVTGLDGMAGAPDGLMPASVMRGIAAAFPKAELVDVSHELRALRATKSPEEVAVLAQASMLVERAVDRVTEVARPGSTDLAAWGAMVGELVRGGSTPPGSSRWGTGLRPLTLDRPPHAHLQRGSILVLEPEASLDGYRSRATRLLALEACDSIFRDLCAVQAEYWQMCCQLLVPERPLSDLFQASAELLKRIRARPGRHGKISGTLALVGCGLGLDAPTITSQSSGADDGHLQAGWVFELHAPISLDIGPRVLTAAWSDVVAMAETGARRLGRHEPGLIVLA